MGMKFEDTPKDPAQSLAMFGRLPEKTKELLRLKDQQEKTTGPEGVVINRQIHHTARQ